MDPQIVQLLTLILGGAAVTSAAGAFYKVLTWIVGDKPKLHSHSEVVALQSQIEALVEGNRLLVEANKTANATLAAVIQAGRNSGVAAG